MIKSSKGRTRAGPPSTIKSLGGLPLRSVRQLWDAGVGLVDVVPELITINLTNMGHLTPGMAHGSRFIPHCTECLWFQYVDLPANRLRFALLAVLYGWMVGAEKQFFYSTEPPNIVYSFDHDAFFPRGPKWSVSTLDSAGYPEEDDTIVEQCGLSLPELKSALVYLERVTPTIIASALGSVPLAWNAVTDAEQIALANFLWERCETMRSCV